MVFLQDKLFLLLLKNLDVVSTSSRLLHGTHIGIAEDDHWAASKVKLSKGGIPYSLVEAFCKEVAQGSATPIAKVQVVRHMPDLCICYASM